MGLRLVAVPRTAGRGIALWGSVAGAALALLAIGAVTYAQRDRSPVAASSTAVAAVRRGAVTVTEAAAGTVAATNTRGLSFAISGTVTELGVAAGATVTSGQVLARIDDADARDAVASAESGVATAEQALADAQTAASAAAGTSGCQAPAAYRVARSPSPAASPSPSGRSSAPAASPSHPAGPAAGASPTGRQCTTSQGGSGGRAGGSLLSAQQQLNNAKLTLTRAQADLDGTVITAPIDARVLSVAGTVGTAESPGSTAFLTLVSTQDTQVQAQFSEADVAGLKVGQPATISLASRSGALTGKVSQIYPAATVSGQLVRYPVMIAFDRPPADVLYGQSADVVVTTGSESDVLYVSSSAVTLESGDRATVTVRTGARDERRTVHTGLRGDQYTEIRDGLAEGEQVVLPGGG
jgi:multidrug efflux pump subunit AcrA (membrane-fusion protein)